MPLWFMVKRRRDDHHEMTTWTGDEACDISGTSVESINALQQLTSRGGSCSNPASDRRTSSPDSGYTHSPLSTGFSDRDQDAFIMDRDELSVMANGVRFFCALDDRHLDQPLDLTVRNRSYSPLNPKCSVPSKSIACFQREDVFAWQDLVRGSSRVQSDRSISKSPPMSDRPVDGLLRAGQSMDTAFHQSNYSTGNHRLVQSAKLTGRSVLEPDQFTDNGRSIHGISEASLTRAQSPSGSLCPLGTGSGHKRTSTDTSLKVRGFNLQSSNKKDHLPDLSLRDRRTNHGLKDRQPEVGLMSRRQDDCKDYVYRRNQVDFGIHHRQHIGLKDRKTEVDRGHFNGEISQRENSVCSLDSLSSSDGKLPLPMNPVNFKKTSWQEDVSESSTKVCRSSLGKKTSWKRLAQLEKATKDPEEACGKEQTTDDVVDRCRDDAAAIYRVDATPEAVAELVKIENKIGDYTCRLCFETFVDAFQLAGHNCSCIARIEYRCPDCEKVFNCPANLASHRRWHRPKATFPAPPLSQPPATTTATHVASHPIDHRHHQQQQQQLRRTASENGTERVIARDFKLDLQTYITNRCTTKQV